MEASGRADAVGLGLERGVVGQLGVFELLDAGEMPVDEHVVGQRPEMLGELELGRIGRIRRQAQPVDVLGHARPEAGVPAGPIQHERDPLRGAGSDRAGVGGAEWQAS